MPAAVEHLSRGRDSMRQLGDEICYIYISLAFDFMFLNMNTHYDDLLGVVSKVHGLHVF